MRTDKPESASPDKNGQRTDKSVGRGLYVASFVSRNENGHVRTKERTSLNGERTDRGGVTPCPLSVLSFLLRGTWE